MFDRTVDFHLGIAKHGSIGVAAVRELALPFSGKSSPGVASFQCCRRAERDRTSARIPLVPGQEKPPEKASGVIAMLGVAPSAKVPCDSGTPPLGTPAVN